MRVVVKYKHWKTGAVLMASGKVVYDNPQSDRLVLQKPDGSHVDIIKSTIIERKAYEER